MVISGRLIVPVGFACEMRLPVPNWSGAALVGPSTFTRAGFKPCDSMEGHRARVAGQVLREHRRAVSSRDDGPFPFTSNFTRRMNQTFAKKQRTSCWGYHLMH